MFRKIFKIRYRRRVGVRKRRAKSQESFELHKARAHALVMARLQYFQSVYRDQFGYTFLYKKVTIKNQFSRWGSCSRKGNLNFNYRIVFLPPEQADYLIVHELCHLGEFNHSKNFWDLVEKTTPNWKKLRHELKEGGKKLF